MKRKRKWEVTKEEEIPLEKGDSLSIAELDLLCELAGKVHPRCAVMEIANQAYESTEALARGVQPVGTGVFNLSLYGRNQSSKTAGRDSDGFENRTTGVEKASGVTFSDGSVYDLSRRRRETIGLLLVIGYQYYEEVREAVVCWQGLLVPETVIIIHNCHEPGPARAIREFITDGGNFVLQQSIDNMAVLVMDRCQHYWAINSNEVGICRNCGRKRNFGRLNREIASLGIRKRTSHRMK